MPEKRLAGPATLFYSYAHEDEALRERLEQHLSLLQRQGLLLPWHDRQIEAGEDWRHAIDESLEAASIILLLISPAFMASDYCYEYEMRRALERQSAGEALVIPILLRDCDWHSAPFGHLQALPRNGRAITSWGNEDEAFSQVSLGLRSLLTKPIPAGNAGRSAAQSRANMLIKLQRMYGEVLDDSLQKLAWIDLPLNTVSGAVDTPANRLLRRTTPPAQCLAPGTTIEQVFEQANQELLILGDPGSGKSTLLYQLGRDLLTRTQQAHQPLPIVFPLASWSTRRLPLEQWMVEQLRSPLYKVRRWQSQQWVDQQQILPLLDGLDEVEEAARPACIAAINAYHSEHITPLVVCSRSQEYQTASHHERLQLHNAIEVQSLTAMQQQEALQQLGNAAEALWAELATNEKLRELVRTPLWLNILLVTTREAALPPLPHEHDALQREVLRRYVERMCERKGNATRYPLEQTQHWLAFLANQMRQRNQVFFALEDLQPDWLTRRSRRAYSWSVALLGGLGVALVFGLIVTLVFGLIGGLLGGLLFGLVGGLLGGLLSGLFFGLLSALDSEVRLAEYLVWSWKGVRHGLLGGLLSGLLGGLVIALISGLLGGLSVGLIGGLIDGPTIALIGGLLGGLAGGLLGGLVEKQVVERDTSSPGKGVYRSMRNGLFVGLFFGLLSALVFGLIGGLLGLLVGGLIDGLAFGLLFGLVGGLLGWLLGGLLGGLIAALQHLMLRFWLARTNCLPWRAIAFLNDTCERALLKRVGGTYRFIHRLVLDHFADQEPLSTHSSPPSIIADMSDHPVQH